MTLNQYIDSINKRQKLGNATEHTFRGDLQQLLESLVPTIRATNEPQRQSCGAPDYIITKKDIPVGFIEAKDIGDNDLDGEKKAGNREQFDRYKASLNNIIFTDYLNFHLYHDGQFVMKIAIGEITGKGIKPLTENFSSFENLIKDFCSHVGQTIKSSKKLAEMMAGKARLLSDIIEKALTSDETQNENSTLKDQMNAFKQILIHDITPKGFADVYAQTIAYGMFAARLHDPSMPTFSRQEAAELIPRSNPFLRKLFGYIAGPDIDDRIKWIVDSLVEIFLACNVEEILKNFGKTTKMEDPIIHFYETFLSEYDPKLRKARGVWYTPAPVVNFIVRAVDDILKTEFDLPNGLADNCKTKIKVNLQETDNRYKDGIKTIEQEVHKVQILDPATGTGTFLAEVIKQIHKKFDGQQGIWSNYVETHLLPRLNGFELLMASYAMAHLQLDLLLTETGYKPTTNQRFRVFLTNSLEESHPDTGTLFANWLSTEANEANHIKRDTPVMCVIGNPPYIRQEDFKHWKDYLSQAFSVYTGLSDLYVFFVEKSFQVLRDNGDFCFILPNKWMQTGYGKPLKSLILNNKLNSIIDFGDLQVFEEATTYPCILSISKDEPAVSFLSANIKSLEFSDSFQEYVNSISIDMQLENISTESWIISSSFDNQLISNLKLRFDTLDGYINGNACYGIKSGLTEAFIIDDIVKQNLINEDANSIRIIKPLLQGRDINPYSTPVVDKYLLYVPWHFPLQNDSTINGNSSKAEKAFKDQYPAIYNHLYKYKAKLEKRNAAETGIRYEWYALQRWASEYIQEFEKPKIMYQRFQVKPCFIYDEKGLFCNDSIWFLPTTDKVLLAVLNSKMGWWLISKHCTAIQNGYQLIWDYLKQIPIATANKDQSKLIISLVDKIITAKENNPQYDSSIMETEIDKLVYQLYGLTEEEIKIVEGSN